MRVLKALVIAWLVPALGMALPQIALAKEMRCGWIDNPTPANWYLTDADGEWLIGAQGGFQADGLDHIGDLTGPDWIVTNGSSYGYGCACLSVDTQPVTMSITQIHSVRQLPLSRCKADKNLPVR